MNNISFEDFYYLMKIEGIIIIEDAIQFDRNRTAVMYDYLKMQKSEQVLFTDNISNKTLAEVFIQISKKYEENKDKIKWEEVPPRDIEFYLTKNNFIDLIKEVNKISSDDIEQIINDIKRFGIGIKNEAVKEYAQILNGIQQEELKLPLRIYEDFSAEDCINIGKDFEKFTENNKYCLLIIDDFLGENPRGDEIIKWVNNYPNIRNQAVCILLSSRDREQFKASKENMYIEYIKKGDEFLEDNIKRALIKSQYSIMLQIMKNKRIQALAETYNYALENINVAVYLSAMASEEGTTNYNVITNWLDLREKFKWQIVNLPEIQSVIMLSSMINKLVDEKLPIDYLVDDIKEIQIFEDYDYSVNKLYVPPMSGDIFLIKGEYYLLIGQDCDLSIRKSKRNTPIAELLPIKRLSNHDIGTFKEKYGYEKIVLENFKDIDEKINYIEIDCTKSQVIDNEILDLCILNSEGKSFLNLEQNLTLEQRCYLPDQWEDYYSNIKKRTSKLLNIKDYILKNSEKLEFTIDDIVNSMGSSHGGRLVSITDFTYDDNCLTYDVQRVCRIKNHVLLANKLHLEYKGRQAFNTINMDIGKTTQYTLKLEGVEGEEDNTAVIVLTNKRSDNNESKFKNRNWVIKKQDIIGYIKNHCDEEKDKWLESLKDEEDDIMLKGKTGLLEKGIIKYIKLLENKKLTLKLQL